MNAENQAWVQEDTPHMGMIITETTMSQIQETFLNYWEPLTLFGVPFFQDIPYTKDGNKLTIELVEGSPSVTTFSVSTDTLTLTDSDGDVTVFKKKNISTTLTVPASSTTLTKGEWKDDSIDSPTGWKMYSFPAAAAGDYYAWWNDGSTNGGDIDNEKTLEITVYAMHSNGEQILNNIELLSIQSPSFNTSWSTPSTFTAPAAGTIYLWVVPSISADPQTGTFAIVWDEQGTTRPERQVEPDAFEGTWVSTTTDETGSLTVTVTAKNGGVAVKIGTISIEMVMTVDSEETVAMKAQGQYTESEDGSTVSLVMGDLWDFVEDDWGNFPNGTQTWTGTLSEDTLVLTMGSSDEPLTITLTKQP